MGKLKSEHIELLAQEVLRWPTNRKWTSEDKDMRFKSIFGVSSRVTAKLWNRIMRSCETDRTAEPKHLLWALAFLKNHSPCEILCCIVGWPNSKTFSKWAWYFVGKIAELKDELISLENQFNGLNGIAETNCFMSADGADCPVF